MKHKFIIALVAFLICLAYSSNIVFCFFVSMIAAAISK